MSTSSTSSQSSNSSASTTRRIRRMASNLSLFSIHPDPQFESLRTTPTSSFRTRLVDDLSDTDKPLQSPNFLSASPSIATPMLYEDPGKSSEDSAEGSTILDDLDPEEREGDVGNKNWMRSMKKSIRGLRHRASSGASKFFQSSQIRPPLPPPGSFPALMHNLSVLPAPPLRPSVDSDYPPVPYFLDLPGSNDDDPTPSNRVVSSHSFLPIDIERFPAVPETGNWSPQSSVSSTCEPEWCEWDLDNPDSLPNDPPMALALWIMDRELMKLERVEEHEVAEVE